MALRVVQNVEFNNFDTETNWLRVILVRVYTVFYVVLRPYSLQRASKDVHYFHAMVPHLHPNYTKHEEGKATQFTFYCSFQS